MSLRELKLNVEYGTLSDDLIEDFYIPVLKEGITYKRAVGFFSSSILLKLTMGLCSLAKRGGKLKLLISPRLDPRDYEAMKEGYSVKDYVSQKMTNDFDEFVKFEQREDRFGLLAYMISTGLLEIKVAVLEQNNDQAMFHEKLGIVEDEDGDIVCFTGGVNESLTATTFNYDHIDVFSSWVSNDAELRCNTKLQRFNNMWRGNTKGLIILDFPTVLKEKILKYNKNTDDIFNLDEEKIRMLRLKKACSKVQTPTLSKIKGLFPYQLEAIASWVQHDYRGIFDMATGTGKTFTGFGAIERIFNDKKRVFVLICCPYIHLVDQWCEEAKNFDINPIKCYGNVDYKTTLKREIIKFKRKQINFACAILVNRTFASDYVQELVDNVITETLLIVDEAHNFGSLKLSECLKKNYPYRLALSATLDRYADEEGTKQLYNFFGEKCIEYTLSKAITEDKLTPYKYIPVIVTLDNDELEKYIELSKQIAKQSIIDKSSDRMKQLLIKRARLIAGCKDKLTELTKILANHKNENNMLIYCGAVKYGDSGYESCSTEMKQIELVDSILYKEHITYYNFTSDEDSEQRTTIINAFKDEQIQALVAIKCLDEGVNIPAIKTAFILASSTNPKEYIQRRGRVLRKSAGKRYAVIYDFITLPYSLEEANNLHADYLQPVIGLVKRELARLIDFNNLSLNPIDCNKLIEKIKEAYKMNVITNVEGDTYE